MLKFSVVFAMLTVPPRLRVMALLLSMVEPLLIVDGPAMTTLFASVKAAPEIRLSAEPALSVTEPLPSEVARAPMVSTPESMTTPPESPVLALVRMRLPPPCLRKPFVPVSAESMVVLAQGLAPSQPAFATIEGFAVSKASVSPLPML